jgi:broad specificity phosphatase PhoE
MASRCKSSGAGRQCAAHHAGRHPDDAVVLVGHDSVNRVLLLELLDLPLSTYWRVEQNPCCINEIDIAGVKLAFSGSMKRVIWKSAPSSS